MEGLGHAIKQDYYPWVQNVERCKIDQIKDRACIVSSTGENQKLIEIARKGEEEM